MSVQDEQALSISVEKCTIERVVSWAKQAIHFVRGVPHEEPIATVRVLEDRAYELALRFNAPPNVLRVIRRPTPYDPGKVYGYWLIQSANGFPDALERLEHLHAWAARRVAAEAEPLPAGAVDKNKKSQASEHPDGPDGDCWVWWKGTRHDVPKGNVFRLIKFFWDRDSAKYDDLDGSSPGGGSVFLNGLPTNRQINTECSVAGKALKDIGVGWRLKTNSTDRIVTKQYGEKPKKRSGKGTSKSK